MLENYFINKAGTYTTEEEKRAVAVGAALEIARSSAAATTQRTSSDKVQDDLRRAADEIALLADAIQAAIEKNNYHQSHQ